MSRIRYIVMDVDGTLTDGKIYMGSEGEMVKAFNIKDGYGIHDIAIPNGIEPVIITGRNSAIVEKRCEELGIRRVHQGVSDKLHQLMDMDEILVYYKGDGIYDDVGALIPLSDVAYIGDDLNDLSCIQKVKEEGGVTGCPADAVEEVKAIVDYVSPHKGGDGAVRDFIEWIVKRNKYEGED